jgi:hypothetical protein
MAYATLGQLDARLTEIDDLLIRADLRDVQLAPSERSKLVAEAEEILNVLAQELGKLQNLDPREVYQQRKSISELRHIAAVTERHVKLHPNDSEADRVIAEAFQGVENGKKTKDEAAQMIASVIFRDESPVSTATKPEGSFARWFNALRRILTRK